MQNNLAPVWNQVEIMLNNGISVIPVRDRDEKFNDKIFPAKTPFKGWKEFQQRRMTRDELWYLIEKKSTAAVAIICGAISNNLEVIDIDVKYKPGCESAYFAAIQSTRPDLWEKLRIHQSPSGGFHILYHIAMPPGPLDGNQKLAKRPPNESELANDPKARAMTFIETRGEGGYVLAPPSLGYRIIKGDLNYIPIISWEDRCSLINLAKLMDEMPVVVKPPKPNREQEQYYAVSPWESFNYSQAAENVLIEAGWKYHSHGGDYTHFTRPGKSSGVSASFIHSKRLYFIFTTNGGLEADRGYQPSTVLSELMHGGDRKKTWHYLVQNGYGQINPAIEQRIAKKSALENKPLPKNISADGLRMAQEIANEAAEQYPFGVYWEIDYNENKVSISRERVIRVAGGLGFALHLGQLVRIDAPFIHSATERDFFDSLKAYIKETDYQEYMMIADAVESFLQRAGTFTISRLPIIKKSDILSDDAKTAYKFYRDVVLVITADGVFKWQYQELNKLVKYDLVQQRDFHVSPTGKYIDYLRLAVDYDNNQDYVEKILGYLCHNFKDETTGYIVVLTESCPDPKSGGGSGKNVFGALLKGATTYINRPGAQVRLDEKLLQSWRGERVMAISDVPQSFDWAFLKELSSGSGILKRLYQNEIDVDVSDMPKFIIQTNYSYDAVDGGVKRRIIPLEFGDYFTRCGGIDAHFGCHFPGGWDADDWAGYDYTIIKSIQTWLKSNRKLSAIQLSQGGWLKQFRHNYGQTIEGLIEEYWQQWRNLGFVSNDDFKKQVTAYYEENDIPKNYRPGSKKINSALLEWGDHHGQPVKINHCKRTMAGTIKGKLFNDDDVPF